MMILFSDRHEPFVSIVNLAFERTAIFSKPSLFIVTLEASSTVQVNGEPIFKYKYLLIFHTIDFHEFQNLERLLH
jgi:hypothetical protein